MAVHLQTAAIETLTRRIKMLEQAMPGLHKRLSASQVETIYGISRKRLYWLSDPRRKGSPIRRWVRAGERRIRFDRADIERWLMGVPVESVDDRPERSPGRAAVRKINGATHKEVR